MPIPVKIKSELLNVIACHIRAARTFRGLSTLELSAAMGTSQSGLIEWENGGYGPDAIKIMVMSRVLNISVAFLLGETDTLAPPATVPSAAPSPATTAG